MKHFYIFQCFPSYHPSATARIINSIPEPQAKILLDLEDSISDFENPGRSAGMKNAARADLKLILAGINRHKVSLRINPVNSDEYPKDKILLHEIAGRIEYVFIPKTNHPAEILKFYNEFGNLFRICPIVESKSGIENLPSLTELKTIIDIEFIFFGNYDYHLDQNLYPITEQDDARYWELVSPVIRLIESASISFGNSPYANIGDLITIKYIHDQLQQNCMRRFACVSLHKSQTNQFNHLIAGRPYLPHRESKCTGNENVPAMFMAGKLKGRSFAVNRNLQIITPQEFILSGRQTYE